MFFGTMEKFAHHQTVAAEGAAPDGIELLGRRSWNILNAKGNEFFLCGSGDVRQTIGLVHGRLLEEIADVARVGEIRARQR